VPDPYLDASEVPMREGLVGEEGPPAARVVEAPADLPRGPRGLDVRPHVALVEDHTHLPDVAILSAFGFKLLEVPLASSVIQPCPAKDWKKEETPPICPRFATPPTLVPYHWFKRSLLLDCVSHCWNERHLLLMHLRGETFDRALPSNVCAVTLPRA
jgi:hypothetical protein